MAQAPAVMQTNKHPCTDHYNTPPRPQGLKSTHAMRYRQSKYLGHWINANQGAIHCGRNHSPGMTREIPTLTDDDQPANDEE